MPLSRETLVSVSKKIRFLLEMHRYSDAVDALIQFVWDAHRDRVFPSELKVAILHCITIIFLNSPVLKDNIIFASKYQDINHQLNLADTAEAVSALVNEVCTLYKEDLRDVPKSNSPPALKKAIDYICENYMYRLTLDDLAGQIFLNKNYISQMFMKHLGISFGNYLESVRIYKAQELLRNTEISVTKIAEESGYTSQSYFAKAFKKRVGVSPMKYRAMSLSDNLP